MIKFDKEHWQEIAHNRLVRSNELLLRARAAEAQVRLLTEPTSPAARTFEYPVDLMYDMLRECRRQFEHYVTQHEHKGTPEGSAKAEINRQMVNRCDAVIKAWEKAGS